MSGDIKRLVVKLGTTTIADKAGRIDASRVRSIVEQVDEARRSGVDVALVSSGAIAAGAERMGLDEKPREVEKLQAVAAVGQGILMRIYTDLFSKSGVAVGQVLLTQSDMTHRQQYLNARHTLEQLFSMGVVPVINENDTVATEEITFGDNDMLAALVASLTSADLLVLLTDTEGLYRADPRGDGPSELIRKVDRITGEIEGLCSDTGSRMSTGGMSSKVQAAKVAVSCGVKVVIADGRSPGVLRAVLSGVEVGTTFTPEDRVASKKRWIGYARKSMGTLVVDEGAARAITREGRSLLPAGVVEVHGEFSMGDTVDIVGPRGEVVARGLANYGSDEADLIKGMRSDRVAELLGEEGEEMVHRDHMVVLGIDG